MGYIDATFGLHWGYIGVTLGLHLGYIEVTLRLHWGYIEVTLGLHWGYSGRLVASLKKVLRLFSPSLDLPVPSS